MERKKKYIIFVLLYKPKYVACIIYVFSWCTSAELNNYVMRSLHLSQKGFKG